MEHRSRSREASFPWAGIAVLVLVAIFLVAPGIAAAELRYTTAYRENPIRGVTAEALWRSMGRRPIIDEDGAALANITHDHTLSVETGRAGGTCRVRDIDFAWRFVITLPKAVDEARMSRRVRRMWQEFTSYLKRHEEHHRAIFLDCGKAFLAEAGTFTGRSPCFALKNRVRRFIDEQYEICMARQRAFDRDERPTVNNLALRRAYPKREMR